MHLMFSNSQVNDYVAPTEKRRDDIRWEVKMKMLEISREVPSYDCFFSSLGMLSCV